MRKNNLVISVIGLGYVGLPVAVAFAKSNYDVIGFDLNKNRLNELKLNNDKTGEVSRLDLKNTQITFSNETDVLKNAKTALLTKFDGYLRREPPKDWAQLFKDSAKTAYNLQ